MVGEREFAYEVLCIVGRDLHCKCTGCMLCCIGIKQDSINLEQKDKRQKILDQRKRIRLKYIVYRLVIFVTPVKVVQRKRPSLCSH